jgi:hypothetical protein
MGRKLGWAIAIALVIAGIIGVNSWLADDTKAVLDFARVVNYSAAERSVRKIPDAQVRVAVDSLRAMGPKADRVLIKMSQMRDNALRRTYSWLWSRAPAGLKLGLPRPVPALAYRQIALSGLGNFGPLSPSAERALIRACDDPEQTVRERATIILGYRGSRSAETLRAFRRALSDPKIAARVAYGPREFGFNFRPASVPEMIEDLGRPYHEARYTAARALCERGAEAWPAVPALMSALGDENEMVHIASIRALGAIGPAASNALAMLHRVTEEGNPLSRSVVQAAIRAIEGRQTGGF